MNRRELITRYRTLLEERRFLGVRRAELSHKMHAELLRLGRPLRFSSFSGHLFGAYLAGDSFVVEPAFAVPVPADAVDYVPGREWRAAFERMMELDAQISALENQVTHGMAVGARLMALESLRTDSGYVD